MKGCKPQVFFSLLLACFLFASVLQAQQQPPPVQVDAQQVAGKIYVLTDTGGMGNSAVLVGDDGVLLVDAKVKESVDLLLAKVANISKKTIRFEVVTHWHFDHVGGNEKVAGAGALIIGHDSVRKQMSIAHDMKLLGVQVPPSPTAALPMLTYQKAIRFYMDGEEIEVFHPGAGHTDGDSVIFFKKENVIHLGDLFFNGLYPFIGIYSGGSIDGMIHSIQTILPMIDGQTKVIPGHGPVAGKGQLQSYLAMLVDVRNSVDALMKKGLTMVQVVAAKPTKAYDAKWGKGFLSPEKFVEIVYSDLSPTLP